MQLAEDGTAPAPPGFWRDHDLTEGDFTGLARKLLQKIAGSSILIPLDEAEKGLRLVVKRVTLGGYFSSVMSGEAVVHLSRQQVVNTQRMCLRSKAWLAASVSLRLARLPPLQAGYSACGCARPSVLALASVTKQF